MLTSTSMATIAMRTIMVTPINTTTVTRMIIITTTITTMAIIMGRLPAAPTIMAAALPACMSQA